MFNLVHGSETTLNQQLRAVGMHEALRRGWRDSSGDFWTIVPHLWRDYPEDEVRLFTVAHAGMMGGSGLEMKQDWIWQEIWRRIRIALFHPEGNWNTQRGCAVFVFEGFQDYINTWATQSDLLIFLLLPGGWTRDLLGSLWAWITLKLISFSGTRKRRRRGNISGRLCLRNGGERFRRFTRNTPQLRKIH